jgi:hypothetical protein
VVRGSDGFYTEYAHITLDPNFYLQPLTGLPYLPLMIGQPIRKGDLLGWVDNSGYTIGDPSIHIGRYTPGDSGTTLYLRPSPCDWYIQGVDSPLMLPPANCFPHGFPHHYLNR